MTRVRATFSQEVANVVKRIEDFYFYVSKQHISSYKEDSYADKVIHDCFNIFKKHERYGLADYYSDRFDVLFELNKLWHLEHDFDQKVKKFIEDNRDKKICIEFKDNYYVDKEDHFYIEYAKDIVIEESSIGLIMSVKYSWQAPISKWIKRVWVVGVENEE